MRRIASLISDEFASLIRYMGAPFEGTKDEMVSAQLMVTVRNPKGRRMLERAVAAGRVQILQEGGHGGRALPSTGDRRPITMKTVSRDTMVQSLTTPGFVAGDRGAPSWVGNFLASIIARTLPKGLEFARYSIDYHFLRNALYCEDRMGEETPVPMHASAHHDAPITRSQVRIGWARRERRATFHSTPRRSWRAMRRR